MRAELRPRPVEMAPSRAEEWEPIGETVPLRLACWSGCRGNPAKHTHPACVARISDDTGRVTITDDDDGGLQWGHPAPTDSDLVEVARWLNNLPVWAVQAIDARLCALGWAREIY